MKLNKYDTTILSIFLYYIRIYKSKKIKIKRVRRWRPSYIRYLRRKIITINPKRRQYKIHKWSHYIIHLHLLPRLKLPKKWRRRRALQFKLSRNLIKKFLSYKISWQQPNRLKTITFENMYSRTIQIRRLGRRFFTYRLLRSDKFSRFFNKFLYYTNHFLYNMPKTIGFAIITSRFFIDLRETWWLFTNSQVCLNRQKCMNFFTQLKLGDSITLNNVLYFLKTKRYFLKINKRWLIRKSRKMARIIGKFIFDKADIVIDRYYTRWLKLKKPAPVNFLTYEIDYRLVMIIFFNNYTKFQYSMVGWLRFLLTPIKHVYIWRYKW